MFTLLPEDLGSVKRTDSPALPWSNDQGQLVPLSVIEIEPRVANTGLDNLGWVRASDGHRYLVKSAETARYLPLNEYLAYRLADQLRIPTPPYRVIAMPNGAEVFGSRDIYDRAPPKILTYYLDPARLASPDDVWRTLIFDLFISNYDRHSANFVGIEIPPKTTLVAIDYSRALIYHTGALPDPFSPNDCETIKFARWFKTRSALKTEIVDETIEAIKNIPSAYLSNSIESVPSTWLVPERTKPLLEWWDSAGRVLRLDRIAQGVKNGEFV
jgi:hypothetical protein